MARRVEDGPRLTPQLFREMGLHRLSCHRRGAPRCLGEAEGSAVRRRRRASATAPLGIVSVGAARDGTGAAARTSPSGRLIWLTDSPEIFCCSFRQCPRPSEPSCVLASSRNSGSGPAGSTRFACPAAGSGEMRSKACLRVRRQGRWAGTPVGPPVEFPPPASRGERAVCG
jgi:hypothetical protein